MSLSSETLRRIEAIFNEALLLPEGDRQKLIEDRCEGDAILTVEVSSLLDACEKWGESEARWCIRN